MNLSLGSQGLVITDIALKEEDFVRVPQLTLLDAGVVALRLTLVN